MTEVGSLICPVCSLSLTRANKQFICDNNHQFDVAKQGYVNLLQPQHKKSKQPGDSPEMVEARYRFLDKGYYGAISDQLNQLLLQDLSAKITTNPCYRVTDAGSGEGYYTQRLEHFLTSHAPSTESNPSAQKIEIIGFDIAQKAVKASCRRSKSIQWVTATSSHIPVADHSQDAVLSLFSRIVPEEFSRILKQDGVLYVASTGPNHLIELRRQLYQDVKQVAYNPTSTLAGSFIPLDQHLSSHIHYQVDIDNTQAINDLLLMTPHYWRATEDAKESLQRLDSLSVTIDIMLTGYRLCPQ
ncbi:putative RNA methyltransferase [Alkalimarinus sediminis]|uniref:Methyltransferase domain-containing protein n=1 Tax=Alkalimarinus sediminis TaxID=1632866 RepID=A0A9E8KNN4_9ALTE|nr:methyltransferase [Alkalimarinus sediminis]UZW73400.1 methyltransferase domain-containing protein [Alkalimarinus sediminis]